MSSIALFLICAASVCSPSHPAASPQPETVPESVGRRAPSGPGYTLQVSAHPDRSAPGPLENAVVNGVIYVFTAPDDNIDRVRFYVDDPDRLGPPERTENYPPFDLAGTTHGLARDYDTTDLTDGVHTMTAVLEPYSGADMVVTVSFTVQNSIAVLTFDETELAFVVGVAGSSTLDVTLHSSGAPVPWSIDSSEPWVSTLPANGTTPQTIDVTVDATGLPAGVHQAELTATAPGVMASTLAVSMTIEPQSAYALMVSPYADRSAAQPLQNAVVSGDIYVFTAPDDNIDRVSFWIDDPAHTGSPDKIENVDPFDLGGTHASGAAASYDSGQLADGRHSITAVLEPFTGADLVITSGFEVSNSTPTLTFSNNTLAFTVPAGATDVALVELLTTSGASADYAMTSSASWLSATPQNGATPETIVIMVDTTGLKGGSHTASLSATAAGFEPTVLEVELTVELIGGDDNYGLLVSYSSDRAAAVPLADQTIAGDAYIFVNPEDGIARVRFYLDDPGLTSPTRTENFAPYDFRGGTVDIANALDSTTLADGVHTISIVVEPLAEADTVVHTSFSVDNISKPVQLVFTPFSQSMSLEADAGLTEIITTLATSNGSSADFAMSTTAPWLTIPQPTGTTPQSVTLLADPDQPAGEYTATMVAGAPGYTTGVFNVTMLIGSASECTPIPCDQIRVDLPYTLDFDSAHGFAVDGNGVGTGFTHIDQPSNGTGYIPQNLSVDTAAGVLRLTTTSGLQYLNVNALDNGLAVGIDAPSSPTLMSTTLTDIPIGQLTGDFQQAGLWWGSDEDNYVKLILLSTPGGMRFEMLMELGGQVVSLEQSSPLSIGSQDVTLSVHADPATLNVTGQYRIGNGNIVTLDTVNAPEELFSFDAAGIDPAIGTRTFGGPFASHRNGPGSVEFVFDAFSVVVDDGDVDPPDTPGDIEFDEAFVASIDKPTAMVWGPDDRLYVVEIHGTIHTLEFDTDMSVTDSDVIDALVNDMGPRLTLGITVDPDSTADDVTLWLSHSSASKSDGQPNSSMVTRLSGPGFTAVDHVITGLPRAKANHAINGLHFGPDGRLYIAMGGNTGAGAPNNANSEFGTFEEQPLSSALIVADVKQPNFDGTCHNAVDIFGPPPCDVVTYATGLRNMYDFTFHSNGEIYSTDNGLGVTGTFPPSPTAPCFGFGDPDPWNQGGENPGTQPDLLHRLQEGRYYGHPNPYRSECVFKDGSFQSVSAPANYEPPMYDLGDHRSANGIIEYTAPSFCGALQGDLLIANYSVGDNITRLQLSQDGTSVLNSSTLARGLGNPLPLALAPNGTVFIGEFGANKVTALVPQGPGCWATRDDVPVATLDAGSAVLDGELYSIAGKTSSGPMTTVYVYDPATNDWRTAANLPGPGVENPAAVTVEGKIYAFGGSTAPFSGATAQTAVYDPDQDDWTVLAPMPTPRGGAAAAVIDGLIYVVGGMGTAGASLTTLEVYDPAEDDWVTRTPMDTPRDNPGAAALGGQLYVFGGRTRLANGTEVDGTLDSVERYDPGSNDWDDRAPMPTGRRTFATATLNGRVQIMGGEKTPGGGTYAHNEEYNPDTNTWRTLTPMPDGRHGMAFGVIDGRFYTAGGGTSGGGSYSAVHQAFTLP